MKNQKEEIKIITATPIEVRICLHFNFSKRKQKNQALKFFKAIAKNWAENPGNHLKFDWKNNTKFEIKQKSQR